jgi:hypothetical protein
MKRSFDDFLIYDIFETLSKYLSVQDIVNVLMVNISCYGNYKYNENYCNKIFVKKIIRSSISDLIILDNEVRLIIPCERAEIKNGLDFI